MVLGAEAPLAIAGDEAREAVPSGIRPPIVDEYMESSDEEGQELLNFANGAYAHIISIIVQIMRPSRN